MAFFDFDSISFGLGATSGVLTTLAVQRVARVIRERNAGRERATVRTYASREADEGYLSALVEYARQQHLLGHKIRLEDILIEPRFIPPSPILEIPNPDEPIENVFQKTPIVHDYPHLHAPYNLKTLSIAEISRGHRRIALIGLQGSGRTTALLTIALWSSGFMEFPPQRDSIVEQLESELDPKKDVPIDTQVLRIRRRIAMARLAEQRIGTDEEYASEAKDPTEKDEEVLIEAPSTFRNSAPIYVHLADIVLDSNEYGRQVDPSEPLIRALQHQTGYVVSRRLVNKTYKLLESGNALILVDGFDDIHVSKRPQAIRWMRALMDFYPDNFFIFAMPTEGYGLLMEAGAVPIYLRPWHKQDMSVSVDKIQRGWNKFSRQAIEYDKSFYETIGDYTQTIKPDGNRLSPFDHTLRTWSIFNGNELQEEDEKQVTFADRVHAYLKDILPVVDDVLPELKRAATVQLDRGFITLENLIDYALFKTETGEDPRLTRTLTQEVMALADTSELQVTEDLDDDARKEREKLSQEVSKEQTKLLERFVKAGILISFRGGRYQFKHKIIASYLAAIDLSDARPEIVYRKYVKPDWEYAMNYLAGMRDVDFLVAEHLDDDLDIRFEKVLKLTNWLKYAPEDVPWRNNLLRYLGNVFASPNQFSVVRERVAAALVSSRDAGARVVFRRGIGTKNPDVRRLCCYALGASRDEGAIDALSQVVMQDPIIDNKIAGQMGLVAMGSEEALLTAIDLFDMASDEAVRRAVTENLAADHEVGYPTLKDMLESESITMRRAALYGTSRVNTPWAWILIDRIFQNDTESFVRLASEVVLRQKFETYFYELHPYPDALEMEWFIFWEQTQKDFGVLAYDTEPEEAFEHAFSKSDKPEIRWLVTGTLGQIGEYAMVDKLYNALRDSDANIRDRAYRSLAEFQEQLGKPIPIPIT